MTDYLEMLLAQLEEEIGEHEPADWLPASSVTWMAATGNQIGDALPLFSTPEAEELKISTVSNPTVEDFSDQLSVCAENSVLFAPSFSPLAEHKEIYSTGTVSIDTDAAGGMDAVQDKPALLEQAEALDRAAAQVQAMQDSGAGHWGSRLETDAYRRAFLRETGSPAHRREFSPLPNASSAAPVQGVKTPDAAGGRTAVQQIDQAFQRDSRRYDRGFSLY